MLYKYNGEEFLNIKEDGEYISISPKNIDKKLLKHLLANEGKWLEDSKIIKVSNPVDYSSTINSGNKMPESAGQIYDNESQEVGVASGFTTSRSDTYDSSMPGSRGRDINIQLQDNPNKPTSVFGEKAELDLKKEKILKQFKNNNFIEKEEIEKIIDNNIDKKEEEILNLIMEKLNKKIFEREDKRPNKNENLNKILKDLDTKELVSSELKNIYKIIQSEEKNYAVEKIKEDYNFNSDIVKKLYNNFKNGEKIKLDIEEQNQILKSFKNKYINVLLKQSCLLLDNFCSTDVIKERMVKMGFRENHVDCALNLLEYPLNFNRIKNSKLNLIKVSGKNVIDDVAQVEKLSAGEQKEGKEKLKQFWLERNTDATGTSGIGTVAVGVIMPSGKAVLEWLGDKNSVAIYKDIDEVEEIHGHNGKTKVILK